MLSAAAAELADAGAASFGVSAGAGAAHLSLALGGPSGAGTAAVVASGAASVLWCGIAAVPDASLLICATAGRLRSSHWSAAEVHGQRPQFQNRQIRK